MSSKITTVVLGGIWAKNTLQTIDFLGVVHCIYAYERLPSPESPRPRCANPLRWAGDRVGYFIAPFNWLPYFNTPILPEENRETMGCRGCVKKYNDEVRRLLIAKED